VGFFVMGLGAIVIGRWVAEKIKTGTINESAATTALYMDSFIDPNLQELGNSNSLTPENIAILDKVLKETNLGRQVVTIKVWDKTGSVLYSNTPSLIGRNFPPGDDLILAWQGRVVALITDLQDAENFEERKVYTRLLEIYTPVRLNDTNQVIAVAEFYVQVDALEKIIVAAQRRSWYVISAIMMIIYLILAKIAKLVQ
jgi:hypothetical protein